MHVLSQLNQGANMNAQKGVRFSFSDEIDAAEFSHAVSHSDNFVSLVETNRTKTDKTGEKETTFFVDVLYKPV